ncbi:MAG: type 1 glutamine amidotransferase [Planctomycetota bacterium]
MVKALLLQAREAGEAAGPHERAAFREVLGVSGDALRPWDLLRGPPPPGILDETDCVLVGGSGRFGMGDAAAHAWLKRFIDFMGLLAGRGPPTFASCFGFQALVVAGGGTVETDRSRAEVGTFELTVTREGAADPLFAPLAPAFAAQLGHQDHVTRLPADLIHLARSERSPFQAVKVKGRRVYATQFHPELTMARNRERFLLYRSEYAGSDMPDPAARVLERFRPSPAATDLLRRFWCEELPRTGRG